MRRFGSADEIGLLAVYLASAESGYVNGSVFAVDGGVLKHL
jgi:NAD(P)-dependent dehydrogenase (short-subunit alcohol dehydrogenase family)